MRTLLLLLLLCPREDDKLRIDGAPFLILGDSVDYELSTDLEDVTPVWRIADAPGGILAAFETKPKFDARDFTIRGAKKITIKSVGKTEGEMHLAVSLERNGRRVATDEVVIRVGKVAEIPAQFRLVTHAQGGSRATDRYLKEEDRKRLQDEVNSIWRGSGVRFVFSTGKTVKGEAAWFDEKGRFHPVILKDEKKAKSPSLVALLRNDDPDYVDIYVVRDCHWTEKAKGLGDATVDHSLSGVGLQESAIVIDDSADAVTLAHELGHFLGLNDLGSGTRTAGETPLKERRRLMFSIRKFREGNGFTFEEMKTARGIALKCLKPRERR